MIELPERAPDALAADKAYDSDAIRDDLKQRGICASSRRNLQQAALPSAQHRRLAIQANTTVALRPST
jgi:hypothetical protein